MYYIVHDDNIFGNIFFLLILIGRGNIDVRTLECS